MEETVKLGEILIIMKKRSAKIVSAGLIGLGISEVVSYFIMDKQYSSAVQMIVELPKTNT